MTKHNWWRFAIHKAVENIITAALFDWGYLSIKVAFDADDYTVYTSVTPDGEHIYTAVSIAQTRVSEAEFKRAMWAFRAWKPTE